MSSNNQLKSMQELIDIMALLRSDKGCQWDRAQTPVTLKKHILEEAYEVLDAIDSGHPDEICDELGDLLLQVVFQAQIFTELGHFSLTEIAESISKKLIRRHPHIFADASHEGHEQRWEEIKKQERTALGKSNKLEQRIPSTLPALKRATKVAKKCAIRDKLDIVREMHKKLQQLENELLSPEPSAHKTEKPLAELLLDICMFSAANNSDPEDLLRRKTNELISEIDS